MRFGYSWELEVSPRRAGFSEHPSGNGKGLHPFQAELLEILERPDVKMVLLEAPVGAGKTTTIRKMIEKRRLTVVTFPTTILAKTQSAALIGGEESVFVWPHMADGGPREKNPDMALVEFTGDALLRVAKEDPEAIRSWKRGELLHALLGKVLSVLPGNAGKRSDVLITTPDVLWLVYSRKYSLYRSLREDLQGADVVFDEYHCYANLENFRRLLSHLFRFGVGKVVLMSATPYPKDEDWGLPPERVWRVEFHEGEGEEGRIFNHQLRFHVLGYDYFRHSLSEYARLLAEVLKEAPRPAAVILDSVFRAEKLLPVLKGFLSPEDRERVKVYDGVRKEEVSEVVRGGGILLGTSSVEVGVDMAFSSLVFEARNWVSAIQRLGRVGRFGPGEAFLVTPDDFEPYLPPRKEVSRTELEQEVLKGFLPPPKEDWVSGELFRGDDPTFLVVSMNSGDERVFRYGPPTFSLFRVEECLSQVPETREEAESLLRSWCFPEERLQEAVEDVVAHTALFPLSGTVVVSELLPRYDPVREVRRTEGGGLEVRLASSKLYRFSPPRR